jgi:hypothetical protein
MRMRRVLAGAACLLVVATVTGPSAAGAAAPELSMSAARVSTRIGDDFRFKTVVANRGATRLSGLVAHLNVVSWDAGVYVDPEDWSSQRTRYLPPLPAGDSIEIPWTVKAVNAGHFAVYAVVLGAGHPAVGPALDARVVQRRTIDAGGVVPLAVGVPGLLGLAMLGVRRRRPR